MSTPTADQVETLRIAAEAADVIASGYYSDAEREARAVAAYAYYQDKMAASETANAAWDAYEDAVKARRESTS
jgi:hypothetical protein